MHKRSLLVAVIGLSAALASAVPAVWAAGTEKTGVVDLQRCLGESKMGKKYKAEFSAKAEQAKGELEKKEGVLKELRDSLEKQALVLSPAARAEKEKEYRDKREAFQEQYKATLQSLQRQDQELTNRVMKDLQSIIKEMAESGGYSLIVERQEGGVLYFSKELEVTDEVIRRYDQKAKD